MKKHFFLLPTLISTLVGSGLLISPTFATSGDSAYWTFEELSELAAETEAEMEEFCAEDDDPVMCKEMYTMQKQGEIYGALIIFESSQLTVTRINPGLGYFRVHYNDEDLFAKHMGISYKHDLDTLHIVQYDGGYITGDFAREIETGVLNPKMHIILSRSAAKNGAGWLQSNAETEFPLRNQSTAPDVEYAFWYSYTTERGGGGGGKYDYSSCIESPDYQEGMECKIVYDKSKAFYIPVNVESQEPEDEFFDEPHDDEPQDEPGYDEPSNEPINGGQDESSDAPQDEEIPQDIPQNEEPSQNEPQDDNLQEGQELIVTDSGEAPTETLAPKVYLSVISSTDSDKTNSNTAKSQVTSGNTTSRVVYTEKTSNSSSNDEKASPDNTYEIPLAAEENIGAETRNLDAQDDMGVTNHETESSTAPWWILAVVILCSAAFAFWWFMPSQKGKRNNQN